MSPEQARGHAVDKRTDIWAFGCVLFEMLAGRRPFGGDTISDTFVTILEREPDWSALPAGTPASIRTLLDRCLRKDPRKRLHDIADAFIVMDDRDPAPTPAAAGVSAVIERRRDRERLGWAIAVILGVALMGVVSALVVQIRGPQAAADPVQFTIGAPDNWLLAGDAFTGGAPDFPISPDGRLVALRAFSQGLSMLWVRSITKPPWRRLEGTEGASSPFWSPDSQSIGFFANEALPPGDAWLKTVRVSGGLAVELCRVPHGERSATWSRHGVIVFGGSGVLQQISSGGGQPTPVTKLGNGENAHRWPWFLPDDEHFLYLARRSGASELRVGSLTSTDTWSSLGPFESNAVYAQGHLIFIRGGKFTAQSFDASTRQLAGDPIVLADQTADLDEGQRGLFSASETGVLGYSHWRRPPSQLTWMDRTGKSLGPAGAPGYYVNLGLSLDDRHVAVSQVQGQPGERASVDIWLIDLARAGAASRLTDHPAGDFDPAWSPDGLRVAFNSSRLDPRESAYSLFVRPSNGSGRDELLVKSEGLVTAPDWSLDGKFLVYGEQVAATGYDL